MHRAKQITVLAITILLAACSSHPPMKTVNHVDLARFMGDWYVIANIPTFLEKEAHNAVKPYEPGENGTIRSKHNSLVAKGGGEAYQARACLAW